MSYDVLQPFSLLLFVNALFSVTLAVYVVSVRQDSVSWGLAGVLLGAGVWSVADGLRIAAPTAWEVLFWNKITYVGVAIIPPATVLFVAAYTDRERWRRPRRIGALGAVSVGMLLAVATNHWHGLWRPAETVTPGTDPPVLVETLGIVHVGWVVYVLFGIVPLLYVMLGTAYRSADSRLFRRQLGLMLLGVTAPVVGSTLYVGGVTPIDLTPVGFAGFGLAVTVGIHRYQGLDIVPIARDTVVENVDAGMVVVDRYDRVVDVNPQVTNVLGTTRDDAVGQPAGELFEDYETVREAIDTLEDETTTMSVEVDGEQRHYRADFSAIRDTNDHLLGRVVIFNDITEEVSREQQLVEQTELLERKNERLDQFASMVSHDLRNPLNIAALRLEEGMGTDDDEALEAAGDALDRMDEMLEQLLMLARVESAPKDGEPIQLRTTAVQAWQSVNCDSAELDLEEHLGEIEADSGLVVELFENLFRNAVEHNDQGVTISVGRLDNRDRGFFIADDGTGIPTEQREQIFDHGYTTDGESTGFGLSIVDEIVATHDWERTVTESDAGGARFEIRTG